MPRSSALVPIRTPTRPPIGAPVDAPRGAPADAGALPVNAADDAAVPQDGRRLRSQESRRRIVEAMMALVRDGVLEPSAELVAERAGVGLRSVFRHFKDMEGLRREMSEIVEGELRVIVTRPFVTTTPQERLRELIDRRVEAFERVMPYRRAGNLQVHRSQFLQANNRRLNDTLRSTLKTVVGPAIAGESQVFEALDLALCIESWIRLRHDQGLDADAARAVLVRVTSALMGSA